MDWRTPLLHVKNACMMPGLAGPQQSGSLSFLSQAVAVCSPQIYLAYRKGKTRGKSTGVLSIERFCLRQAELLYSSIFQQSNRLKSKRISELRSQICGLLLFLLLLLSSAVRSINSQFHASTAIESVLNTTELLEQILLHLP